MGRVSILAAGLVLAVTACDPPDPPSRRGSVEELEPLTRYVDPFIGTGGHGHVYPGATVPFGMVQLSPDQGQSGWDWIAGYNWEDSIVVGFSHTHLSGTGASDYGDIRLMPTVGDLKTAPGSPENTSSGYASRFEHRSEEARAGFQQFLSENPNSELAGHSQYWLGETYYVTQKYPEALAAFQKAVSQYPQSRKLPDALLKVGYCNYELGNYADARAVLTSVTEKFPESTAARLAGQRLDRMKAEGR